MMKHTVIQSVRRALRAGVWSLVSVLSVGLGTLASLNAQSLTWLGTLPGGGYSHAHGVSADGTVVVGVAGYGNQFRAFRWTAATGMQDLGTLGGGESWAYGVSADGTVVVGMAQNASGQFRAFRWTQETGMQDLGTLGGDSSAAWGVSADGTVVVGVAETSNGSHAFRWVQNQGMEDLNPLGVQWSWARGVSADGTAVVGVADNASGQFRAFRWTQETGMQDIGTLGYQSYGHGVSADGTVVVGLSRNASDQWRPFRWTAATRTMEDLGTVSGCWRASPFDTCRSEAYGVSADGTVVVGGDRDNRDRQRAFRWVEGQGMEDLNITYASLLPDGSSLRIATAISPDGRYIVGEGYNASTGRYEAFLLDTGTTCQSHNGDVDNNGCVDDADLLAVLFAFGNSGNNLGRVDVNCDTVVDDADLLTVLFNFGSGC